jgi:TonB family protein
MKSCDKLTGQDGLMCSGEHHASLSYSHCIVHRFRLHGSQIGKAGGIGCPPGTATSTAAVPTSAQIVDRGAETSRAIDHGPAPQSASADTAIQTWQLSVIQKLAPFMKWPDDAPYWVETASPEVRVTIDRQGKVLKAAVVRSSGYESFDAAARKIFKRAAILPPPPAEMPGDPLSFNMAVTFTQ